MIIITISKENIKQLRYERYNHPHPRVQQKMEALLLKAHGLSHDKIGEILEITQNTLRSYFETYKEGGIEALKSFYPRTKTGELDSHTTTLVEEFKKNPPLTLKEAADRIEQLTGVKRSTTAVSKYLKKTVLNG
jgi:transposase